MNPKRTESADEGTSRSDEVAEKPISTKQRRANDAAADARQARREEEELMRKARDVRHSVQARYARSTRSRASAARRAGK